MIRISGRPVYDPGVDGVPADQLPLWQAEDLRADIIWWAHYCLLLGKTSLVCV